MKNIITLFIIVIFCGAVFGQGEIITNKEIILMTQAGLSKSLIVRKIKESKNDFNTSAESLIELKKAGVSDEVIRLMMDAGAQEKTATSAGDAGARKLPTSDVLFYQPDDNKTSLIVISPKEALMQAKTIAIKKSSLYPSRQSLEKKLLQRPEWKDLGLNIVRYKKGADLTIEIGRVSLTLLTRRYVYRVFDTKSGTVIASGETTSWGSLAGNLARGIAKRLKNVKDSTT